MDSFEQLGELERQLDADQAAFDRADDEYRQYRASVIGQDGRIRPYEHLAHIRLPELEAERQRLFEKLEQSRAARDKLADDIDWVVSGRGLHIH